MKIEIDIEAEKIFEQVLIEDYKINWSYIRELLSQKELAIYQKEDLEHCLDRRGAFETLIRYYFESSRAQEIIRKEYKGLDI